MKEILRTFFHSGEAALRLDVFLTEQFAKDSELAGWTRSQIKRLILAGQVQSGGKALNRPGAAIKGGTEVVVCGPFEESTDIAPWDYKVDVLFEDEHIIVINKAAGISMHPGAGDKKQTLVNALVGHFSADLMEGEKALRAGIVHRLDKDTTGAVVIAKNAPAHAKLSAQFAERSVEKVYLTLALCMPRSRGPLSTSDEGTLETLIARHPRVRTKMAVTKSAPGKSAVTHWRVVERMHYASLVHVNLATGRTHQIRVHFDSVGSPVIGDKTYGEFSALPLKLKLAAGTLGRQALHAWKLSFNHPQSMKRLTFEAKPPADFENVLNEFRKFKP